MSTAIYRTEDPALETIEFGAVYQVHVPYTGDDWTLYRIADDCGVNYIEPLEIPDGWEGTYEYAMADTYIWPRLARLARDADLAHATLEIALVPVVDEQTDADSYALLYRLVWAY